MAKITVQNTDISVVKYNEEDYISLTDMARSQFQEHIIFRWLCLKSTIEHLGEWSFEVVFRWLCPIEKQSVTNTLSTNSLHFTQIYFFAMCLFYKRKSTRPGQCQHGEDRRCLSLLIN